MISLPKTFLIAYFIKCFHYSFVSFLPAFYFFSFFSNCFRVLENSTVKLDGRFFRPLNPKFSKRSRSITPSRYKINKGLINIRTFKHEIKPKMKNLQEQVFKLRANVVNLKFAYFMQNKISSQVSAS